MDLILTGIKKLVELVPIWVAASAEQRAEIEGKARSLVGGLDELFKSYDARDDSALAAALQAIKDASPKL